MALKTEETECYFFTLPPELRNTIYGLALESSTTITVRARHFTSMTRFDLTLPSLLHVCKGIRSEALPLFFGQNTICFELGRYSYHGLGTIRWRSLRSYLQFCTRISVLCPEGTYRIYARSLDVKEITYKPRVENPGDVAIRKLRKVQQLVDEAVPAAGERAVFDARMVEEILRILSKR